MAAVASSQSLACESRVARYLRSAKESSQRRMRRWACQLSSIRGRSLGGGFRSVVCGFAEEWAQGRLSTSQSFLGVQTTMSVVAWDFGCGAIAFALDICQRVMGNW